MSRDEDAARTDLEATIMEMGIEGWKFSRLFQRLVTKLDPEEGARFANQLRYFQRRLDHSLEGVGMKIVNTEGAMFDPGMAASPLNIADFSPDDELVVEQMVEPIIMGNDGLRKQGVVMLRRK